LLESILEPNKAVKEGYHSLVVNTLDGKVITGIKLRESPQELVLRDAEGREIQIPKADIDETRPGRSLMPDGTHDPLTRTELIDLVKFLSVLGKVGSGYQVTPGPVVRRWEMLQPTKELFTLLNRQRLGAIANPANSLTWMPIFSRVSGDLPLDELPRFRTSRDGPEMAAVRCQIDPAPSRPRRLLITNPDGLSVWIDGQPVSHPGNSSLPAATQPRTITIAIDLRARSLPLRLEVRDDSDGGK
jgi:hypothetical protein